MVKKLSKGAFEVKYEDHCSNYLTDVMVSEYLKATKCNKSDCQHCIDEPKKLSGEFCQHFTGNKKEIPKEVLITK